MNILIGCFQHNIFGLLALGVCVGRHQTQTVCCEESAEHENEALYLPACLCLHRHLWAQVVCNDLK